MSTIEDEYNSAGSRIKLFRQVAGWSQDDLADKAGTTKSTVSKIERGAMAVTEEWAQRFGAALDVDPLRIFGDLPLIDEDPETTVYDIPVIGTIAAGTWREAIQHPIDRIKVVGVGKDAFGLRAEGDSMDLLAPEGAYIVVEPHDRELHDGRVYAVMNADGETTFKTFRTAPARLEPRSSNPNHKPIFLGEGFYQVVGRVTQIVQKL